MTQTREHEEAEEEEEKKKWRLHERDRLRFCPLCSSHTVRHRVYAMLFITYAVGVMKTLCTMFFFLSNLIL
jgi:hypothetical protein